MSVAQGPDDVQDMYDDIPFLAHADSPYHRGSTAVPAYIHSARNPACGDWVRLELVMLGDGRIAEAWFDGRGCLVSQAAASILCQTVEGRMLGELRAWTAPRMLDLLGVPLAPGRLQCGLLAFKVLKTIVYSAQQEAFPLVRGTGLLDDHDA